MHYSKLYSRIDGAELEEYTTGITEETGRKIVILLEQIRDLLETKGDSDEDL